MPVNRVHLALSKTSGSSLEESRGPSMSRQPQLNGPIQVGGHATQQRLCAWWPIAARGDCPAKPALDDRDARRAFPPLARGLAGTGQVALAAVGTPRQAAGWPPCDGWNVALDAKTFAQPAGVGRGLIAAIGQQARPGPPGQRLSHQGAHFHMIPPRPPVGELSAQDHGGGPHRPRPRQPGPGAIACAGPQVVIGAGWGTRKAWGIHGHRARARADPARASGGSPGGGCTPTAWNGRARRAPQGLPGGLGRWLAGLHHGDNPGAEIPAGTDRRAATVASTASGPMGWPRWAPGRARFAPLNEPSGAKHTVSRCLTSSALNIGRGAEVFDRANHRDFDFSLGFFSQGVTS